jgi:hypothetical protein
VRFKGKCEVGSSPPDLSAVSLADLSAIFLADPSAVFLADLSAIFLADPSAVFLAEADPLLAETIVNREKPYTNQPEGSSG